MSELGAEMTAAITSLLRPAASVEIVFDSGRSECFTTPLSREGFMGLWNKRGKTMKIPTGDNAFTMIRKSAVVFFSVEPYEE